MENSGYIDYVEKVSQDGSTCSYEEISHQEGWTPQELFRIEFELEGYDKDARKAESATVIGFELADHFVDRFVDYEVGIPQTVMSTPVTAIAPYASNHSPNDNYLRDVKLPETLKSVGYAAFADTEMEAVEIPAGVTEIGEYAFGYDRQCVMRGDDGAEIGFEKIEGFVISCYPGTAGEKYAKDNGFEYKLL